MTKVSKLRGQKLTDEIERICQEYISKDPRVARITRSLIQRKLGQSSRSTLVGERGKLIDHYADQQRRNFNITKTGIRKKTDDEKLVKLRIENEQLKRERDQAVADYASIMNGLKMKGINLEDVLYPIFNPHE
ncbi:hypothetical protein SAMN04488029_0133 [Reichenbachiella faecimaris]|uniref:Transposase n=1 Tax=Reichenbachiella faecimaris TaxID=692418 RepID=A0A1W2G682_REIFA|nr:hypothetical protein [Reichenbachiella faecimaris]SMD31796.1 hypothetical protein SAMN04488029_0133 [Reichenbachiella faecimaris]